MRVNIAQDFEDARRFLGWSFQDVSEKLAGRYSSEYLKQVHRGEPLAEVSDALKRLYVGAFAKKAVGIALEGVQHTSHVRIALIDGFIWFVRRKNLTLGDAKMLSESVRRFRGLVKDPSAIEVHWEKVLEAIIRERNESKQRGLNKSEQGRLIEGDDEIAHSSTLISLASDLPRPSYQPKRHPKAILAECSFCHQPLPENRDSKHSCGHPNDDYL